MSIISDRERASARAWFSSRPDPEVGLDPGQQLAHPERLGDEVGRAEAERADGGLLGRHRGDHQDRQVLEARIGLDPLQELQPVHLGHHDVEQQQIERLRLEMLEQVLAAGDGEHVVAVLLEDPGEGAGERLIVVGDEDLGSERHSALPAGDRESGSTLPPLTTATVGPAGAHLAGEQRGDGDGAGRLDA